MHKIKVHLKNRSYDILTGHGLIEKSGPALKRIGIGKDAFIITNRRIARLYKNTLARSLENSGFSVKFAFVADSEKAKSIATVVRLTKALSAYDCRRQVFIIALGGGVVGDVAGFVASVYKRGIPYVQVPTTLLSQVDSAIGGKVAVDLPLAKNFVGAFYQPRMVISDTSLLKSLSKRQVKNGLAEVVKYGVIKDRELFEYLEKNYRKILNLDKIALEFIISRSAGIKASVVEKDELDRTGVRAGLNYGHTLGHAIESAGGYSGKYNHGEAISVGMVIAARISEKLGLASAGESKRIEALLKKIGLPTKISCLKFERIRASYARDKKFIHGKNRLVLPVEIGKIKIVEGVPDLLIREVVRGTIVK